MEDLKGKNSRQSQSELPSQILKDRMSIIGWQQVPCPWRYCSIVETPASEKGPHKGEFSKGHTDGWNGL
jgi:hypothetical protein